MLQHALCLTVYECKGLEFEDVILYNFFNDAPQNVQEQWKLLNLLQVERIAKPKKVEKKIDEADNGMQDLDDLNFDIVKEEGEEEKKEEGSTTNIVSEHQSGEYEERIGLNNRFIHKQNFYKEFSSLCTDLK